MCCIISEQRKYYSNMLVLESAGSYICGSYCMQSVFSLMVMWETVNLDDGLKMTARLWLGVRGICCFSDIWARLAAPILQHLLWLICICIFFFSLQSYQYSTCLPLVHSHLWCFVFNSWVFILGIQTFSVLYCIHELYN